jgi:hypothetical protein
LVFLRQAVGHFLPPSFPDRNFAFNLFIGKNGGNFRTFLGPKIQVFVILDKAKELGIRRSRNGARLKANDARLNLHHRFFGKFLTEPAGLKT